MDVIRQCNAKLKGGYSKDLSYFTQSHIKKNYPNARVEVAELSNHYFIVIGRKQDSHLSDFTTWYDDRNRTVILDPWSEEIYQLSEFRKKQKNNKPIPMYDFYEEDKKLKKRISDAYYLSGDPIIQFPYSESCTYDNIGDSTFGLFNGEDIKIPSVAK